MTHSQIILMNTFDDYLTQKLNEALKPSYDIMNYNDYFNEQPIPIKQKNDFVDITRSMIKIKEPILSISKNDIVKDEKSIQGMNSNVNKYNSNYVNNIQSGMNGSSKYTNVKNMIPLNILNQYMKPKHQNNAAQKSETYLKILKSHDSDTIENKHLNTVEFNEIINQSKMDENYVDLEMKTAKKAKPKKHSQKFKDNKLLTQNNKKENQNDRHKGKSMDIDKSKSIVHQNYITNLNKKYQKKSSDKNIAQNDDNQLYKSYITSKKIFSRLVK